MTTFWKFTIATLTLGTTLAAEDDSTARVCSNGTLKGTYALTITGTRPAPRILPEIPGATPGTIEQVIGVFLTIFDGQGVQRAEAVSIKGSLSGMFPVEGGTGPYTVKPDCTGTFTANTPGIPAPLVNQMVIFDRGKEFRSIISSPQGVMISVTGRRIRN